MVLAVGRWGGPAPCGKPSSQPRGFPGQLGARVQASIACSGLIDMRAQAKVPCALGPTSMRKLLSRPEQDDCGTSQTSIRHQPRRRRAMREYAVAPTHASGVALRHVGPPGCNLSPALDLDVGPSSDRSSARRGPSPATGKRRAGVRGRQGAPGRRHGGGVIPTGRPLPSCPYTSFATPPALVELSSPGPATGPVPEASAGASAGFSCQTVARFSNAHITRTM